MSYNLTSKQKEGILPIGTRDQYNNVVSIYQSLVSKGVPPQAALDLVNQKVAEKGWTGYSTGDNKKFNNVDQFTDHLIDWHSRMYPDSLKANNFNEFWNGIMITPTYKYNPRGNNYKQELLRTRPGVKKRINFYRKQQGLSPLALNYNSGDIMYAQSGDKIQYRNGIRYVKERGINDPFKAEVVNIREPLPELIVRPTQDTWNYIEEFQKDIPNKSIRNTMAMIADKGTIRRPQQDTISRIRKIYNISGRPKVKDVEDSMLNAYGELAGKKRYVRRPHYYPITNTMYLPRIKTSYGDAYEKFIPELAHPYLNQLVGTIKGSWGLPGDIRINGKDGYHRPEHFEYKTHRIVEPLLDLYISRGAVPSAPTTIEELNNEILSRLKTNE